MIDKIIKMCYTYILLEHLKTNRKKKMKDIILSFLIIVGFLSTLYLSIFYVTLIVLIIKAIAGTATQSGTGEFFQFAIRHYWTLIVSCIFSILFYVYIFIHYKNEKRRDQEKKYSGSLIGKPL